MPFKVEFGEDGTPTCWATDGESVVARTDEGYRPSLYAAARADRTRYLDWLADALADDPKVAGIETERHFRDLRADDRSPLLRIDADRTGEVRQLAREIRQREHEDHAPGVVSLYDVDLDPQFRYCLDTGREPVADRDLRTLSLSLPDPALAESDVTALSVDGERAGDTETAVRDCVETRLAERDPDVLVCSSADIVPALAAVGVDLGRRPGYEKLAGASTYASYGRVGHSPARYDVPGRVLVDRSNSFLLGHSSLAGLDYFVDEAGKPLQEIAHDSIGGVLTAIEIRAARERDVLAPWQKRQTEGWKDLDTLQAADRGGFTFQPDPGVHESVHELDFASLYPNVIREYDVSPETVCCDCHDRADVPELGYSVCDEQGFLGDVLADLLDDRQGWKRQIAAGEDDDGTLAAKAEAVKWVLVSCFGCQGYRHAKYGRIEVHEAINAYARDIMLQAKEAFERAGWRVVHGIVDSLWVTADPGREQRPVTAVASEVSEQVGIELEHEGQLDWVAFCPRKRASGAALMRYFGRWSDGEYKYRGIDARQRTTCAFVADAQRDLIEVFDRERAPGPVVDRLRDHLARLRRGDVPVDDLAIRQRVSKPAGAYQQSTRAKAALQRAEQLGLERHPGQSVEYVIVDDTRDGPRRVRLAFEDGDDYDADCYADRLLRACASVVATLGWDEQRVRRTLRQTRDATLSSFGD
jgi:DNA polymerase I